MQLLVQHLSSPSRGAKPLSTEIVASSPARTGIALADVKVNIYWISDPTRAAIWRTRMMDRLDFEVWGSVDK